MRGMHSALVAAAAMSLAMGNASGPAILNRVRYGNKLGRRLRRKFELGMAGAF